MARVLIAEHNQTIASYLAASLKKAGNYIEVVDNYLDAWRLSSRDNFDILMVDVVMPGIDGFVLAQKILQDNPDLQVIFITGFAGVAMDTQATPVYAPAPITMRPFHLREAASRIRYLMGLGGLPVADQNNGDGRVVYADFSAKEPLQSKNLV
jgi:two-component system cell cycle response regulator CpdR